MRKSRRQALIQLIEKVALALALLDAGLYFALVRPLANWAGGERQRWELARRQVAHRQASVEGLEKARGDIPKADVQVKAFFRNHIPPRRTGFSRAARLVRRLTDQSGLRLSDVGYKLGGTHDEPLERMEIEVSVEGPFPNLLKFAHALETASDFIVVRDFAFEPGEGGRVGLRLVAELYLAP